MAIASASVSVSAVPDFELALTYALRRLGTPQLCLKDEQKQAIEAIYRGRDIFAWLPTGFGKSVCFHSLPFVLQYKSGLDHERMVSLLVSFVLLSLSLISKEDLANTLNLSSSARGLSSVILFLQSSHMWDEKPSPGVGSGTHRRFLILPAHTIASPLVLNKDTALLLFTTALHSLHSLIHLLRERKKMC